MKLKDYIEKSGISITKMAARCGISFHHLYNAQAGDREPKLRNALRIMLYTKLHKIDNEFVDVWDMIPEDEYLKIHQEVGKD